MRGRQLFIHVNYLKCFGGPEVILAFDIIDLQLSAVSHNNILAFFLFKLAHLCTLVCVVIFHDYFSGNKAVILWLLQYADLILISASIQIIQILSYKKIKLLLNNSIQKLFKLTIDLSVRWILHVWWHPMNNVYK